MCTNVFSFCLFARTKTNARLCCLELEVSFVLHHCVKQRTLWLEKPWNKLTMENVHSQKSYHATRTHVVSLNANLSNNEQ